MATNLTALEAHRDLLLSRSAHWSRGYRQADGLQFVLFSGSAGRTYLTSESGCNCRGYLYRGTCAHVAAVRTQAERARAGAFAPKRRIEDLWPDDMDAAF